MFSHHTKNKGDFGVLKCQISLYEQGYLVLTPNTEHSPFDLVAYKDGVFKRIQVKYRSASSGKIDIIFRSSWADKNGTHEKPVDKNEIDLYCIYCPETDKCYYFDPSKYEKSFTLRIDKPKNNQTKGVNYCSDFLLIP